MGRRLSSGLAPGIVGRVERANRASVQAAISAELMVPAEFDAAVEVERRVAFLVEQLAGSGLRGWVLGVSGGVDSATTGRLCQLAAERLRADGGTATFVAMRLPYRAQADEEDAQRALAFIRPDTTLTWTSARRTTRCPPPWMRPASPLNGSPAATLCGAT